MLNAEIAKIAEFDMQFDGPACEAGRRSQPNRIDARTTGRSQAFLHRSEFGCVRRVATPVELLRFVTNAWSVDAPAIRRDAGQPSNRAMNSAFFAFSALIVVSHSR